MNGDAQNEEFGQSRAAPAADRNNARGSARFDVSLKFQTPRNSFPPAAPSVPYNSANRCKSIKGRLVLLSERRWRREAERKSHRGNARVSRARSTSLLEHRASPPLHFLKFSQTPTSGSVLPKTRTFEQRMTSAENVEKNAAKPGGPKEPKDIGRRQAIPILHTRGTHYDIGFDIGHTFSGLIQEFVDVYKPLNETYLPMYETEVGKKIYEETLACVQQQFPEYLKEIEGTADGANVPFHKLFLMHLDDILPNVASEGTLGNTLPVGCSTVMCNQPGQEILGHNEDALSETLNYWYLVSAHVIEPGCKEERFTSLSYAGFLPGYTMGCNDHGLVYTINTLSAASLRSGKTPRYFLTRALLTAENYVQAQQILRDEGCGAAEGFSVNMTFLQQDGDRMFHNAEVGPCEPNAAQSQLSILTISPGENTAHCNKYLRLKVPETGGLIIDSSEKRMEAICKHPPAKSRQDVINILSDQTDDHFRVYQEINKDDPVKTIATGIFDCIERTWTLYTDKPSCTEPILVIPLHVRNESETSAL